MKSIIIIMQKMKKIPVIYFVVMESLFMSVVICSPVWMSHLQQLSTLLGQEADGLSVVLDGLLEDQVFLQQLQCAWLILVGGYDTNTKSFS